MLRLNSIELHGFKSFPDRTVIEFADGITAIVGPNGSGKSNIADALRWVMGETSSKTLRGSKMEDVIFDGTKERKAQGFAQVTINFDNSDGELDIAYSEVSITRKYFRSGDSEYYINGSEVRLRDIQNLLRDTGLGKDGYSIIGQGAVTDIISAKSTDRRDVFEEAAGISGFKFKRDESARKLRLTNDNITRLGDILSELAARLPVLEKQSEKAKKYLAYRDEKKILDIGIWLSEEKKMAQTGQELSQKSEALNRSLEQIAMRMAFLGDLIDDSEKKNAEYAIQIESVREAQKVTQDSISDFSAQILVLQNEIAHFNDDIARLVSESETDGKSSDTLVARLSELNNDLVSVNSVIETIISSGQSIQEKIVENDRETDKYFPKISESRNKLSSIRNDVNNLNIKKATIVQQLDNCALKSTALTEDKSSGDERLVSLRIKAKQDADELKKEEEALAENGNRLSGVSLKSQLQNEKLEKLSADCAQTELDLAKSESRYAMLCDMEKNHEGFNGSVQTVLKEASRGILRGIKGTVAEILNVPSQYTVAIETALAGAFQNIVTEKESDAKNAVYYLKSRNAGRATFLPMTSVKGNKIDVSGIKNEDGYIGIASEIVSCDRQYIGIADDLLGRTVVVDNLDNAADMAKEHGFSFKIVTLDGQIINPGGSITGGSSAKSAGVFSRRNEIETLSESIGKLKDSYEKNTSELDKIKAEANRLLTLIDEISEERNEIEKTIIEKRGQTEYNEKYISDLEEQLASIDDDIAENIQFADKLNKDHSDIIAGISSLQNEEKNLVAVLTELESSNSGFKDIHDSLVAQLNENKIELLKAENRKAEISAEISRTESSISDFSNSVKQRETEIESIHSRISGTENSILSLQKEIDNAKSVYDGFGEDIRKIAENRQKLEKKVADAHEEEKDLYEQKESTNIALEKISAALSSAEEKLNTLQARLWDDYEVSPSEAREQYSPAEDIKAAVSRSDELKTKIRSLGEVNVNAIEEYIEVKERHDNYQGQINDLQKAKDNIESLIRSLENDMREIFEEKFNTINIEFEKTFKALFNGGEARLSLSGDDDILECGIDIFAAPPGKIIKNMSALSGGEQSLTAIALYFALMKVNPSPFCMLDEIESALDDINVVRFAEYLYNITDTTQIIAITHRRGTMEIADRLYGVTMREKGISKILTINVNEIEKNLK